MEEFLLAFYYVKICHLGPQDKYNGNIDEEKVISFIKIQINAKNLLMHNNKTQK